MSQYTPKSKGRATLTAKLLYANAADVRHCAAGLEIAAKAYENGNYVEAHAYADLGFRMLRMLVGKWLVIRLKHVNAYKMRPAFLRGRMDNAAIQHLRLRVERARSFEPLDVVRAP